MPAAVVAAVVVAADGIKSGDPVCYTFGHSRIYTAGIAERSTRCCGELQQTAAAEEEEEVRRAPPLPMLPFVYAAWKSLHLRWKKKKK